MNKEITAQVHMLPTEFSRLCITNGVLSLHSHKYQRNKWDDTRHLYFLSDEEIKEGDWYYVEHSKKIVQYFERPNHILFREGLFKVIASTDPSLGLPAISTAWIRDVYIPSNGSIKEVKLELEQYVVNTYGLSHDGEPDIDFRLKLTPDNEVVIVDEPEVNGWPMKELAQTAVSMLENQFEAIEQKSIDQELEDAAKDHVDNWWDSEPDPETDKHFTEEFNETKKKWAKHDFICGFEQGATWKAEQSATDAIEFFKWVNLNYIEHGSHYEDNIKISSYVHRSEGGVPSRIEKLYELWKQTKTQ